MNGQEEFSIKTVKDLYGNPTGEPGVYGATYSFSAENFGTGSRFTADVRHSGWFVVGHGRDGCVILRNPAQLVEHRAVDPRIYDAEYYRSSNYADYLEREDRYKKTAYELADLFRKISFLEREDMVIDYGCAVGFLTQAMRELGYRNTIGVEISDWAREEAKKQGRFLFKTIEQVAQRPCALMIALDVFEHMTDEEIVKVLNHSRPRSLLVRIPSSTDGGKTFHLEVSRADPTHINCKTKEQWVEFFRKQGYRTFLKLNLYTIYDTPGVSCFLIL